MFIGIRDSRNRRIIFKQQLFASFWVFGFFGSFSLVPNRPGGFKVSAL